MAQAVPQVVSKHQQPSEQQDSALQQQMGFTQTGQAKQDQGECQAGANQPGDVQPFNLAGRRLVTQPKIANNKASAASGRLLKNTQRQSR